MWWNERGTVYKYRRSAETCLRRRLALFLTTFFGIVEVLFKYSFMIRPAPSGVTAAVGFAVAAAVLIAVGVSLAVFKDSIALPKDYMAAPKRVESTSGAPTPSGENMPKEDQVLQDGTVLRADGTILRTDGVIIRPDGTLIFPDGNTGSLSNPPVTE